MSDDPKLQELADWQDDWTDAPAHILEANRLAEEKTMTKPEDVAKLIEDAGGKVDAGSVMRLPDGSGCMTASFPLPKDHWIYQDEEHPPAPFLMGTQDIGRKEWEDKIREAAKYAVRGATMNGKEMDFDPDAMVQNMIVGMLGYHTPDGKTRL